MTHIADNQSLDPYEVLQVSRGAGPEVINAAHRARIASMHPDTSPNDPKATSKAAAINAARDILLDPVARARYDRTHPDQNPSAGSRGPHAGSHYPLPGSRSTPRQGSGQREEPRRPALGWRTAAFLLWCLVAVGIAQVAALIVALLASLTNLAIILEAVLGVDVASGAVVLFGNVMFAVIFAFLLVNPLKWVLGTSRGNGPALGATLAGVLALAMPVITAGILVLLPQYSPTVAGALVQTEGSRIVVVAALYTLIPGLTALATAFAVRGT